MQDYDGSIPFRVDQDFFTSTIGTITGLAIPTPLYTLPPDYISVAGLNFAGTVDPSTNYTSDLGIPTDPDVYLSFPFRIFDVLLEFGDGDYIDRVNPYQYNLVQIEYEITALTVTQVVPEPATLSLLAACGVVILRWRRQH